MHLTFLSSLFKVWCNDEWFSNGGSSIKTILVQFHFYFIFSFNRVCEQGIQLGNNLYNRRSLIFHHNLTQRSSVLPPTRIFVHAAVCLMRVFQFLYRGTHPTSSNNLSR